MRRIIASYPRFYLDIEVYRPPTRRGRAGFFSSRSKLAGFAIALEGAPGKVSYMVSAGGDERILLLRLGGSISSLRGSLRKGIPLIGYNVLAYDIPFIVYRAGIVLGKKMAHMLLDHLYRGFIHVDLFQDALMFYRGEGLPGFTDLLKVIYCIRGRGEPPDKGTGHDIHEYYEQGRFDLIEEYSGKEIRLLVELYNMIVTPGSIRTGCVGDEWRGIEALLEPEAAGRHG